MTREEALQMTHVCRITSLGEFAHGFVIYQNASREIINQIYDYFEQRITELEAPKTCDGCELEQLPKDMWDRIILVVRKAVEEEYRAYRSENSHSLLLHASTTR